MVIINPKEIMAIARRLGLRRRVFAYLIFLNLVSVCFEIAGIGMLLPIFELIRAGGDVAAGQLQGRHWTVLREISAHLGIPISLGLLFGISFGLILLRQLFRYYAVRYNNTIQREMANDIRQKTFIRYLRTETAIQDQSSVGSLVSLLQTELRRGLSVVIALTKSIGLVLQYLLYFGGLFLLSPIMSLICLGMIVLASFFARGPMLEIKRRGAAMTSDNRMLGSFMVERLKHARLIRLSRTEKAETKAFDQISRRLSEESLQQKLIATRLELVLEPMAAAIAYFMLFLGGQILGVGLEKLGLFAVILIRLVPILNSVLAQYGEIVGQMPSLEWLDKYMSEIVQGREPKGGTLSFDRLERDISYNSVSFSYPTGEIPALRDVSVTLPAYRMIALVGPSGAGKSTFIDLLPRLREPTAGEIRFDGVPIVDFSTASLRGGIAFVPQQPQIFNISAAEHIRYGKEAATDEEVREAAWLAGALEFIEKLPNGFDTLLGDGGERLSGGQRQRLDIARALVRRAPILILDEPTSAMDADAEAKFRDALRRLRRETDLTIIVIAHRLSTIVDAERIIVLRNGSVEAVGSHTELLKSGGWYAKAYKSQVEARSIYDGELIAD